MDLDMSIILTYTVDWGRPDIETGGNPKKFVYPKPTKVTQLLLCVLY